MVVRVSEAVLGFDYMTRAFDVNMRKE